MIRLYIKYLVEKKRKVAYIIAKDNTLQTNIYHEILGFIELRSSVTVVAIHLKKLFLMKRRGNLRVSNTLMPYLVEIGFHPDAIRNHRLK
jgi:hypothetical protein